MPIIGGGGGGSGGGGVGSTSLIYRYTVTGADKASGIDTGVDAPQAGTNDWTNGDLLEVWIYARTDEAVVESSVNITFNNDSAAAHYLHGRVRANAATVTQAALSTTSIQSQVAAASASAGAFTGTRIAVSAFAGTVGNKPYEVAQAYGDTTVNNSDYWVFAGDYASTAAITRLAVIPNTGGTKLKVGSVLLVYKRIAS